MIDRCGYAMAGHLDGRQRLHRLWAVTAGTTVGRRTVGTVSVRVARLPVTVMAVIMLTGTGRHLGRTVVGAGCGRSSDRRDTDQHGEQQGDEPLQCAAIPFAIIR